MRAPHSTSTVLAPLVEMCVMVSRRFHRRWAGFGGVSDGFLSFFSRFRLSYLDSLSVRNVWCYLLLITMVVLFSSVDMPFCMRLLDHSGSISVWVKHIFVFHKIRLRHFTFRLSKWFHLDFSLSFYFSLSILLWLYCPLNPRNIDLRIEPWSYSASSVVRKHWMTTSCHLGGRIRGIDTSIEIP